MIDLSITQNPEWIKKREAVWAELEADFKEGMRKKELQQLKNYFFTGICDGDNFPCLAYVLWFPIKNPENLDFVLENLVKKADVYEEAFYCFISDLIGYGFTDEEELVLWDYFAGDEFKPVVTSRVPVGKEKKVVSFDVRLGTVAAKFSLFLNGWVSGDYSTSCKWKERIQYFITYMQYVPESSFLKVNGKLSKEGNCIGYVFEHVANPAYSVKVEESDSYEQRKAFIQFLYSTFESMNMPPAMKVLWEETKSKKG